MTNAIIERKVRLAEDIVKLTRIIIEVENCTYVDTTGQKDAAVNAIQKFRYTLYHELAQLRKEAKP